MKKEFKMKLFLLTPFVNWLLGQALPGKMSRARNRFIDLFRPRLKEIDDTKKELITKYANKNDKGEPKMLDDMRYDIPVESEDVLNKEWADYMNEDVVFEITNANIDDFKEVKGILLNTTQEFKDEIVNGVLIASASRYDEWCKSFEEALK